MFLQSSVAFGLCISGIEGIKHISVHWYSSSGLFEKFTLHKVF